MSSDTLEAKIRQLRLLLGEPIPEGGSAADTLFTDAQLTIWIESSPDIERAAYDGWRAKAAHFANLVDVTDGAASRALSDLLGNARAMITLYARSSGGATSGRSRVGRIVRQ